MSLLIPLITVEQREEYRRMHNWFEKVERLLGHKFPDVFHEEDYGFCLQSAEDARCAGMSPEEYVRCVQANPRYTASDVKKDFPLDD